MRKIDICRHLEEKIEDWFKTIPDSEIKDLIRKKGYIAGGAISSLLLDKEPNDYDVFFESDDSSYRVASYYLPKYKNDELAVRAQSGFSSVLKCSTVEFKSTKAQLGDLNRFSDEFYAKEDPTVARYMPIHVSHFAITLNNKIQVIGARNGDPDHVTKSFDYFHCMNYYSFSKKELVLKKDAIQSILTRELRYNEEAPQPISSLLRMRKLVEAGWSISPGQLLKIALKINSLDIDKYDKLAEELSGTSSSYFDIILAKLKQGWNSNMKQNKRIVSIIDELF